jgi:hypothetical protein
MASDEGSWASNTRKRASGSLTSRKDVEEAQRYRTWSDLCIVKKKKKRGERERRR